jgi:hypothetical protein
MLTEKQAKCLITLPLPGKCVLGLAPTYQIDSTVAVGCIPAPFAKCTKNGAPGSS